MNGLNLKSALAGAVLIAIVAIVSLQSDDSSVSKFTLDPEVEFDIYNATFETCEEARIKGVSVYEVVEQSPGPEVLATIRCFWGESGFEERVQIFAGNVPEAKQLGRHLLGYLFEVTAYGEIGVKHDKYAETRPPCCSKEYTFSYYYWRDNDWYESGSEKWILVER